jgi:predicted amidohydrolase
MRIALGQSVGAAADKDANLRIIEKLAADAAERRADMLVLPELFLTGYNIGEAVAALAEPSDGPSALAAGRIAAAHGLAIIYGYPERAPEGVYNAAAVIDRKGRRIANYRKIYLWGDVERGQFLAGGRSDLFELEGLKFGLQICYDLDFPELARAQAQSGADGLIVLSATTAPYPVVPRHLVPARAYENQMFVAFANRTGEERGLRYAGESCIAAPDGAVLATSGTGEALVCADVEPAAYAAYVRAHRFIEQPRDETRQPAGKAAR